jgi:hypothetical protein
MSESGGEAISAPDPPDGKKEESVADKPPDAGDGKPEAATTHEDELRQGTAGILTTAKWLVTTFGAVGGAVLAGISFSDLGTLEGTDKVIGILGAIAALVGVVILVYFAARVLTTQIVTLLDLRSDKRRFKKVREELDRSPELRGPFPDIASYVEWIDKRIIDQGLARQRLLDDDLSQAEKDKAKKDLEKAQTDVSDYQPVTRRLRANAQYEYTRQRFRLLLVPMLVGAVLAAAGVGALSLSNTGETKTDTPPAVVDRPVPVTVDLTESGIDRLQETIGPTCDGNNLPAIALSASEEEIDLVTTGDRPGCAVAAISVSHSEAEVESVNKAGSGTGIVLPN